MKNYILLVIIAIFLISCKETKSELIVGKWEENLPEYSLSPDIWTFYKDGTGTIEYGSNNPENIKVDNITYKLIHDEKEVEIISRNSSPYDYPISHLDKKILEIDLNGLAISFHKIGH
jgi:hypothetical protein